MDDFSVNFITISKAEILKLRQQIAMVFQQFNLFK
jgi:polar amino acid transport system ATP-binding protein